VVDWLGATAFLGAVVPLLLALSWGGRDYAWSSPVVVGLLGAAFLVGGLFLLIESRAVEPILPLGLFGRRVMWTSAAGAALTSMGMYCTTLFIPVFLQVVVGRSATQSGAVLTPLMLAIIVGSTASGQAMTRVGRYKVNAVLGTLVMTFGLFLVARMDVTTSYS